MLIVLGSILAGVLLYDHFVEKQVDPPRSTKEDASTVVYHIKSGEGEISLPSCKLMAVETECSPVTDFEKKKYVNTNPIPNKYCS